jgi:hypothetical protein
MKRYLLAALAAIILLYPATASASVSGASRAVGREICFDWECGSRYDIYNISPDCHSSGRHRYICSLTALEVDTSKCYGCDNLIRGKARVTQVGKRYDVDYRLYW